jgi:hypothetical protein
LQIHHRSPGERQEITLNEEGEPIGPTQKIVSEFSNFLGSVARMSDLCPLIYTNWKAIPNKKENIWAYVNVSTHLVCVFEYSNKIGLSNHVPFHSRKVTLLQKKERRLYML